MHAVRVTFDNRANNAPANRVNQLIVGYVEAKSQAIVKPTSWSARIHVRPGDRSRPGCLLSHRADEPRSPSLASPADPK